MATTVTKLSMTGGGSSSRGSRGRKSRQLYRVEYSAMPSSVVAAETAVDSSTSLAIPSIGSADAADTSRKVVEVSARSDDASGLVYIVEVSYETPEGGGGSDNPLSDPVQYEWDFSTASQPYFIDAAGNPVLNSAGEPFENLLERERGEITVTVTDNIAAAGWNPATAAEYMDDPTYGGTAINSATMTIDGISVGIGQARFAGIRCSGIKYAGSTAYRTRTITLKLRPSYDHVLEDRGYHETDGSGGVKEIIKGTPPTPPEKPWPLNGSGVAAATVTTTPASLTFKPYVKKDFTTWGIT